MNKGVSGRAVLYAGLALGLTVLVGGRGAAGKTPEARPFVRPGQAVGSNPYAGLYQAIINRSVKAGLVGLAVYIKTPEEGPWIGTGGYADLETRARIQPDSLFYSASHLKIITATAVMMLWDAGLIDLDAAIDHYLAADMSGRIANAGTATVRNLLSHTSGIPNYHLTAPWDNDPLGSTWRDDIESIYDRKADFQPGSRFQYCNTNFVLLAVIIDRLTGDHADFLSRLIFQRLGMTRTFYRKEQGLPRPPGILTTYIDRYGDGTIASTGDVFPTVRQNHAYGAGGLLASLADYARFSEGLFGGALLSPAALGEMTTLTGPGQVYGYGLGMIISPTALVDENTYGRAHGHGGRGYFGVLEMNFYPKAGVTIGFASNCGYPGFTTPAQDAFENLDDQFGDAVFNKRESPTSLNPSGSRRSAEPGRRLDRNEGPDRRRTTGIDRIS